MRLLSVPGWRGSSPEHWQSLWEGRYPNFERVEQRDWERPRREEWVSALGARISQSEEPVLLVAHSLGCLAVAHWAASHWEQPRWGQGTFEEPRPGRTPVAGALLVAPPVFDDERGCPSEIEGFLPIPTRRLPFPSVVVASQSDPYLSYFEGVSLAESWGSLLLDAGDAGHVNVDSGHGEWPEGEHVLKQLMRRLDGMEGPLGNRKEVEAGKTPPPPGAAN